MTDQDDLPPLPWATSRETRQAERAERRRLRHEERLARHGARQAERQAVVPGRKPLRPERIVDAAIAVLDREGLDALTVRRLATELGAGVMSIYWYVQNKDELLDLVADRVTAEIVAPPAGAPWQDRVRALALELRRVLLAHPAAVPVINERLTLGPNALRLMDAALGIFREAGLSDADAADAYFTVTNYVTGFCAWQTATISLPSRPELTRRDLGAMARDYVATLPPERFPNLVALAPRIFAGSLDDRFAFGLDCLVVGLAARLDAASAPG